MSSSLKRNGASVEVDIDQILLDMQGLKSDRSARQTEKIDVKLGFINDVRVNRPVNRPSWGGEIPAEDSDNSVEIKDTDQYSCG